SVLRQALADESLKQILYPIGHCTTLVLPLFGCRIASLELGGEYLLCRHPGLVQGDASIGSNGVLAQLRPGTASAIQNDEDLTAFWRYLDTETGEGGVPVDLI